MCMYVYTCIIYNTCIYVIITIMNITISSSILAGQRQRPDEGAEDPEERAEQPHGLIDI